MSTGENEKDIDCQQYPSFARNLYFHGKLLNVKDFQTEQKYYVNKQRLINRLIHGSGVVCGLKITKKPETQIEISAGIALDPCGREIVVPSAKPIDLKRVLPTTAQSPIKVFIGYDACWSDKRQKLPETNGCASDCCYSTLTETYKVVLEVNGVPAVTPTEKKPEEKEVVFTAPPPAAGSGTEGDTICDEWREYLAGTSETFCSKECADLPRSGPTDSLIFLGEVEFNNATFEVISPPKNVRTIVYSNPLLSQLLLCQTGQTQPALDLPKIKKTSWTHNEIFADVKNWIDQCKDIEITFNKPMNLATITRNTIRLTLEQYTFGARDRKETLKMWPIPITLKTTKTASDTVVTITPASRPEQINFDNEDFLNEEKEPFVLRLIIEAKGDFICDDSAKSSCLDGNFLRGKFDSNGTGDGLEGGTFESWFSFINESKPDFGWTVCPELLAAIQEIGVSPADFEKVIIRVGWNNLDELFKLAGLSEDQAIKKIKSKFGRRFPEKVAKAFLECAKFHSAYEKEFAGLEFDRRLTRRFIDSGITTREGLLAAKAETVKDVLRLSTLDEAETWINTIRERIGR